MSFSRRLSRLPASSHLFSSLVQHPHRIEGVLSRSRYSLTEFVSPMGVCFRGWGISSSQEVGFSALPGGRLFSGVTETAFLEGITVEDIVAKGWHVLDEAEGDWRSHAAAIAQSIHLIKRRLQWRKVLDKTEKLAMEMEKPDLWDDPVYAGKVNKEHGALMGKIKEVNAFERELLENIDLLKLAREEDDDDMALETTETLLQLRRITKEKELEALLSGEHDDCSCFMEVQAGAGGTESMDWAAMILNMYKMCADRRGFTVSIVDEMPEGND